jgi:hypothetical protein
MQIVKLMMRKITEQNVCTLKENHEELELAEV